MPALIQGPAPKPAGTPVAGTVRAYVAILVTAAFGAWFAPLAPVMPAAKPMLAMIALLAFVVVAGQVATTARNPVGPRRRVVVMDSMFEFAAILLLPWHSVVVLVVVKNIASARGRARRDKWYQTVFNTAEAVVTSGLTMLTLGILWQPDAMRSSPLLALGACLGAALVYCRSNDLLVAGVIYLDGGGTPFMPAAFSLRQMRALAHTVLVGLPTSLAETLTALLGFPTALLWNLNPWYALPMAIPLKLAYDALRIPELERAASTDARTGLANAAGFEARFDEELERAERFARPLSLVMLDLDHFKAVNDEYGHPTGDAVLSQLGKIVAGHMRTYDIAARIGGEEFAVVLPEVGLDDAVLCAERLRSAVAQANFVNAAGTPFSVTISLGVATFPSHGLSRADMAAQADAALYGAKRAGRNLVAAAPMRAVPA